MIFKLSMPIRFLTSMIGALFLISAVQAQRAPQRISFARGATVARARGYLGGIKDEALFVLRAKSGQHMRVEISGRGATRGVVIFPSGKQDGGPGGVVFDDSIDETGDYRIRVTESSMANAWRGRFTLRVDITSENPRGNSSSNNRDLSQYTRHYPSDLFRGEPGLKTRLRTLLGANYKLFFDRLQTEMPIENDGGVLIIRGCMAHQCTIEEGILAIDLADGKLYVAIKSDRYRGKYKTWSEGGGNIPAALRRAMEQD